MNYELAKQLKDAGFPQTGKGETQWYIGNQRVRHDVSMQATAIYFPTLSELIEACGENFSSLNNVIAGFRADGYAHCFNECGSDACPGLHHKEEVGDIPKEAVAKLWLAVHGEEHPTGD